MKCYTCNNRGKALTYVNGRVLLGYCFCTYGDNAQEDRNQLCLSQGIDIEFDKKFRVVIKEKQKERKK